VFAERGERIAYLLGTMIETPRAALIADSIGKQAEFFSFGTNDLTQMTLGFSRDDAGKFLPEYLKRGIYERDPFRSIDQKGVGLLVEMAVKKGREVRPDLYRLLPPRRPRLCQLLAISGADCTPGCGAGGAWGVGGSPCLVFMNHQALTGPDRLAVDAASLQVRALQSKLADPWPVAWHGARPSTRRHFPAH